MAPFPLVSVEELRVAFGGAAPVVEGVSFTLGPGEVLGLVGESGSGKTTVALSLLGYRNWNAALGGDVRFRGRSVLSASREEVRRLRGRHIAYVPQNPTTALNPARRIGSLLSETLLVHGAAHGRRERREASVTALRAFGFASPETVLERYPHQLSGGQQQRVALAIATICRPEVVVLDEPTTGLDVSTQKITLDLLRRLRDERGTAMVYVTHDLSVLSEIATRVAVLYAGRLAETGPVAEVLASPLHPYTRGLVASRPRILRAWAGGGGLRGLLRRDELPPGCPFSPRCELADEACAATQQVLAPAGAGRQVACWRWQRQVETRCAAPAHPKAAEASTPVLTVRELCVAFKAGGNLSLRRVPPLPVVSNVGLAVGPGEVLAIVGESGSGKSTLARSIAGLVPAVSGELQLDGEPLHFSVDRRTTLQRRKIQLVFQNPDASLNPRRRVENILLDALRSFERLGRREEERRVRRVLEEVRLPAAYARRFPDELSGGERQRVAIARGLIVDPQVLICDEVLSALDVSVQAAILELLRALCRERNLAILFISHDLAVVRAVAREIIVVHRGRIVATTTAADMLTPPFHPYLLELLSALPGERVVPGSREESGAALPQPGALS